MFPNLKRLWLGTKEEKQRPWMLDCLGLPATTGEICWRNRLVTSVKNGSCRRWSLSGELSLSNCRQKKWQARVQAEKEGGGLEGVGRPG